MKTTPINVTVKSIELEVDVLINVWCNAYVSHLVKRIALFLVDEYHDINDSHNVTLFVVTLSLIMQVCK